MQVGEVPMFCPDNPPVEIQWIPGEGEYGQPPQLLALEMYSVGNSGNLFGNGIAIGEPIWAIRNSYLSSIRIELYPPFDGTATAEAFVNGDPITLEGYVNDVEKSVPVYAGQNTLDKKGGGSCEDVAVLIVEDGYKFTSEMAYTVDVKITYKALDDSEVEDGTTKEVYYRRTILVWSFGGTPTAGSLYIAPFKPNEIIDVGCRILGEGGIWMYFESPGGSPVFGPYSSKDQAEYVLNRWGPLIAALARHCTCVTHRNRYVCNAGVGGPCGVGTEYQGTGGTGASNANFPSGYSDACTHVETGMQGDGSTVIKNAATGTVYATLSANDGTVVVILPPCANAIAVTGSALSEGESAIVSADWWTLLDDASCPFCEDPGDPEAPEDCMYAWSAVDADAIPRNSAALEAFLVDELGAQGACAALGGTWDTELSMCIPPED